MRDIIRYTQERKVKILREKLWFYLGFCGSEAYPLTLREEYRARCSRWKDVAGGRRKLHNGELHNLPSSSKIIRATYQGEGNRWGIEQVGEKSNINNWSSVAETSREETTYKTYTQVGVYSNWSCQDGMMYTGYIWPRLGSNNRLLWTR